MTNRACVMTFLVVLVLAALAQAQTLTVLHDFTDGWDGEQPFDGVIQDSAGNLYGTAFGGGDPNCNDGYGCGVVFELNTAGTETVLYSFTDGSDGGFPVGEVIRDSQGNIYGTTYVGGEENYCGGFGCGVVYKLDTAGNETVLYSFTGGSDGCDVQQGLVMDQAGNLYGTTSNQSHCSGYGTIFKVDSAGNFTLLHSFAGPPSDGAYPLYGHLTMDNSGNLYGVTVGGGGTGCPGSGCGVLYELTKSGTFTVLHTFTGGTTDGCTPYGSVARDNFGNLYGTTDLCGSNGEGTIWKVSNTGKETILHNFAGSPSDGCGPYAGVTRDSEGNLYGDTYYCGANGYGALYELSANGTFTLLHSWDYTDGAYPYGAPWWTTEGTLFGTTHYGGSGSCSGSGWHGCGTVWEYIELVPTTTKVTTSGSPSTVNQPVTFTATVSSKNGPPPNGEVVTFYDGTTEIGTGTLTNGVALFTTSTLSVKTHVIKASYPGDSFFKPSSGTVRQVVEPYTTSTTLSSSLNPSNYGQLVVLTAVVTSSGNNVPTGNVTFYNGTGKLGTSTLDSSGTATLDTTKLPVAVNSLTATYDGDSQDGKSTSPALPQTVNQAQITMTLSSSPNPSKQGQLVTFTAALTSNGGMPTGQLVSFSYNGNLLGQGRIAASGEAIFTTKTLPEGSDVFTATYAGTTDYSAASAQTTQTVN